MPTPQELYFCTILDVGWVDVRKPNIGYGVGLPCGKASPTQRLNPTYA
ncbi:MAG: hypothetical protein ACRAVC_12780 [Trichormus sp.]